MEVEFGLDAGRVEGNGGLGDGVDGFNGPFLTSLEGRASENRPPENGQLSDAGHVAESGKGDDESPPADQPSAAPATCNEGVFDEEKAQEVFEAWMLSQPYYARRMLAVMLTEMFRRRYELGQIAASQEAAVITGWSYQTVRRFRREFFNNNGELDMVKGHSDKLRATPKVVMGTTKRNGMTKERVVTHRKPRKK